jgi:hypothetical protein
MFLSAGIPYHGFDERAMYIILMQSYLSFSHFKVVQSFSEMMHKSEFLLEDARKTQKRSLFSRSTRFRR